MDPSYFFCHVPELSTSRSILTVNVTGQKIEYNTTNFIY